MDWQEYRSIVRDGIRSCRATAVDEQARKASLRGFSTRKRMTCLQSVEKSITDEQLYIIKDDDPFSTQAEYRASFSFSRSGWKTSTESELIVTCDEEHFFFTAVSQLTKMIPECLLKIGILKSRELFTKVRH